MKKVFSPNDLKKLEPGFSHFHESPLKSNSNTRSSLGWHSTALNTEGNSIGSGFDESRIQARTIALVETIERAFIRNLRENTEKAKIFLFDDYPTSCGFAAGFDKEQTRMNSLLEALERWIRTQWIDENLLLHEADPSEIKSDPICYQLLQDFESIDCYNLDLNITDPLTLHRLSLKAGLVVSLTCDGAFSGSKVTRTGAPPPWRHALLEVGDTAKFS